MFIELTLLGLGMDKVLVNINKIESVTLNTNGITVVCFPACADEPDLFEVEESYEQVKELIKNEVAAERGY